MDLLCLPSFLLIVRRENKCRLPSNVSESLPELIKGFKTSVAVKTLGRWWELSTEETGEHQQCSLRLILTRRKRNAKARIRGPGQPHPQPTVDELLYDRNVLMEEQSVRARWPWSINLGNIRMKSLLHLGIIQQWISYRYARLRRTVGANANGSIDIRSCRIDEFWQTSHRISVRDSTNSYLASLSVVSST
ncbi:hypothetical protein MUK42_20541 [Musa troglodytarum]|uniref:Uncharacterized protein n=1 Tax=Musa troglodytarum TaxID=320322 RepID=A0A9E7FVS8_9LILI|nr:hypothetical protein MUK42_20541 [Musa troglodytarum]